MLCTISRAAWRRLTAPPSLRPEIANHPQFGGLSRELAEIITSCFEREPEGRPTADQLSARCDEVCYLPPVRETGVINVYRAGTFGFIESDGGDTVFFHTQNVVGDGVRPDPGTRVWFTNFDGSPRP